MAAENDVPCRVATRSTDETIGAEAVIKATSQLLPPEARFALLLKADGIPFERHYRFHPNRKWPADFHILETLLLVEVEGGVFIRGRHSRGVGFTDDCEKYAEAMCLGYTVLRVTPAQVDSGAAVDWVKRILERRSLEKMWLGEEALCDCHAWPTLQEFHAYTVALEKKIARLKGEPS